MSHDDFAIHFENVNDGEFLIRVLSSPAGEGKAIASLNLDHLESLRERLSRPWDFNRDSAAELGSLLYEGVFQGQVRDLFDQSTGMLAATSAAERRCLRLVFRLDPTDPKLADLYSIPWELVYRQQTSEFLALSRSYSLVRHLQVPRPARAMPLPLPLRVLVLSSDPIGLPGVDQEISALQASLGKSTDIDLMVLRGVTPNALRDVLLGEPFHVVHFVGHGDFSPDTGIGVLMFADDQGRPMRVSGDALATVFSGLTSVRLVVLNACGTAQATSGDLRNPFAGVATALVLCGIPAVVGMQFPITDRAAVTFSSRFYARLSRGDSIDDAVSDARLAMFMAEPTQVEWATPALFLRLAGGDLFVKQREVAQRVPDIHEAARVSIESEREDVDADFILSESVRAQQAYSSSSAEVLGEGDVMRGTNVAAEQAFDGVKESTEFVLRQIELAYKQTREEARRWSFGSLVAAACGLLMILATLVSLLVGRVESGTISALGSIIPTIISGLFFSQSRIASKRLEVIVEELNAARKAHFAQQIAGTVETATERDKAKVAIVIALLGRQERGRTES